MKIDRFDIKILQLLQENADLSNIELAESISLSPTPTARRVKALEEAGVICGRVTLLSPEALGLGLMAFVQVTMDRHTPERLASFESTISRCAEVLECHLMTGQAADYTLKVAVQDMKDFEHFLLRKLTPIAGVNGVQSSFVLREVINTTALPLPSA